MSKSVMTERIAEMSPQVYARLGGVLYLIVIVVGFCSEFSSEINSWCQESLSLMAAFLGLSGCVIKTLSRLFFIAPLFVLGGERYLSVFSAEQLQALALLLFKINDHGASIAMAFFEFYALPKGYLLVRSTFLPRFLGVLSVLAGLGLLTYLYPPLAYRLFHYIAGLGLLGAVAQIFWLLVFGVNEQLWKEQASLQTTYY